MNLEKRIKNFTALAAELEFFTERVEKDSYDEFTDRPELGDLNRARIGSFHHNAWFTKENVLRSLKGIVALLEEDKLRSWVNAYPPIEKGNEKKIGIVMAGNIPLVGFHDLLCVLISGHTAVCKLSSSDDQLWAPLLSLLLKIDEDFSKRIEIKAQLKGFDAVIATGSNNTARYFHYYFDKYPSIIRKNRNSVALLTGDETKEELEALAEDVFTYFGLGCRNVSKLYLPKGMDLNRVIEAFYPHKDVINHHKYANNYDYNKSVMLLNQDDVIENGFMLFKNTKEIASPLACMFYEYYDDKSKIDQELVDKKEEIQCVVGHEHVNFGKAQYPDIDDYADGVDTMDFLTHLN